MEVGGHLLGFVGADGVGFGEGVEAEVAAGLGPFVVLFSEDSSDEADDGVAVGEDPNDVAAAADLPVESLGLFDQICRQNSLGNTVKARMSARAASRWANAFGSLCSNASRTRSNWACTDSASGWS